MSTSYLYVYGSLKRGQPAHHRLADQELIQPARTLPRYRLYDRGPYPYLVHDPEHGVAVHGEIWKVDAATLAHLDQYEGVPTEYLRQEIALEDFPEPVWAYFYRGDVSAYRDCGDRWPQVKELAEPTGRAGDNI
jgi:gamma-glutamylcyclotransferase (GGCT)/AIG2-like uncharacterized protein YtfP